MSNKYNLDRETYRAIKKMDRVQMEKILTDVYTINENHRNKNLYKVKRTESVRRIKLDYESRRFIACRSNKHIHNGESLTFCYVYKKAHKKRQNGRDKIEKIKF